MLPAHADSDLSSATAACTNPEGQRETADMDLDATS